MTHHLLRLYYYQQAGDEATAGLLRSIGARGEIARELAYRLFNVSEKKKLSQEAHGYNALVLGWPEIARLAREMSQQSKPAQGQLI
jgi:putative DNA methylase